MLCLSQEGCWKSIMLKEKSCVCVLKTYKLFAEYQGKCCNAQWTRNDYQKFGTESLVRSVMSLYEGARTIFRMDSELSDVFEVKWMYQGSVLSPFLFPVMVDVTELARDGVLSEWMYADDLVLISETINGLISSYNV